MSSRCPLHCVTPPHLLAELLRSKDPHVRDAAMSTLLTTARLRGVRDVRNPAAAQLATAPARARRTIYDARQSEDLATAVQVRSEDGPRAQDDSVNRAFDHLGTTRDFYQIVLQRNSIDGAGMPLLAYVHYSFEYDNAFWDGEKMIFGDGDGVVFGDLTKALDVVGHELTHGVTQSTANLRYANQSGALNESVSDVFGSLVKQWSLKQTAEQADWTIGADVYTPARRGDALRSLKEPGSAYDNTVTGKDPQPGHMDDYHHLPNTAAGDNGGVHINSGIPNRAFYLAATNIGGQAWLAPGQIWFEALKASNPDTDFHEFADTTAKTAAALFGPGGTEQKAVIDAWQQVGIRPAGDSQRVALLLAAEEDPVGHLQRQLTDLSAEVQALIEAVRGAK